MKKLSAGLKSATSPALIIAGSLIAALPCFLATQAIADPLIELSGKPATTARPIVVPDVKIGDAVEVPPTFALPGSLAADPVGPPAAHALSLTAISAHKAASQGVAVFGPAATAAQVGRIAVEAGRTLESVGPLDKADAETVGEASQKLSNLLSGNSDVFDSVASEPGYAPNRPPAAQYYQDLASQLKAKGGVAHRTDPDGFTRSVRLMSTRGPLFTHAIQFDVQQSIIGSVLVNHTKVAVDLNTGKATAVWAMIRDIAGRISLIMQHNHSSEKAARLAQAEASDWEHAWSGANPGSARPLLLSGQIGTLTLAQSNDAAIASRLGLTPDHAVLTGMKHLEFRTKDLAQAVSVARALEATPEVTGAFASPANNTRRLEMLAIEKAAPPAVASARSDRNQRGFLGSLAMAGVIVLVGGLIRTLSGAMTWPVAIGSLCGVVIGKGISEWVNDDTEAAAAFGGWAIVIAILCSFFVAIPPPAFFGSLFAGVAASFLLQQKTYASRARILERTTTEDRSPDPITEEQKERISAFLHRKPSVESTLDFTVGLDRVGAEWLYNKMLESAKTSDDFIAFAKIHRRIKEIETYAIGLPEMRFAEPGPDTHWDSYAVHPTVENYLASLTYNLATWNRFLGTKPTLKQTISMRRLLNDELMSQEPGSGPLEDHEARQLIVSGSVGRAKTPGEFVAALQSQRLEKRIVWAGGESRQLAITVDPFDTSSIIDRNLDAFLAMQPTAKEARALCAFAKGPSAERLEAYIEAKHGG